MSWNLVLKIVWEPWPRLLGVVCSDLQRRQYKYNNSLYSIVTIQYSE